MGRLFKKKVTRSEVDRHCIRISKEGRGFFPNASEPFQVMVSDKKVDVIIDKYNRIRILYRDWNFLEDILNLKDQSIIVFSRDPDGTIRISSENKPDIRKA